MTVRKYVIRMCLADLEQKHFVHTDKITKMHFIWFTWHIEMDGKGPKVLTLR